MEPIALDVDQLAPRLGVSTALLDAVLDHREPVTSDLALRLARCFRGTSPQFWLGLQTAHDLELAQARFGAEIAKILPLAA